jgi:hypothetical protein
MMNRGANSTLYAIYGGPMSFAWEVATQLYISFPRTLIQHALLLECDAQSLTPHATGWITSPNSAGQLVMLVRRLQKGSYWF